MTLFGDGVFTVVTKSVRSLGWTRIHTHMNYEKGKSGQNTAIGRMPREDEGRDKDDVSTSQGTPECQQTPTAGGEA